MLVLAFLAPSVLADTSNPYTFDEGYRAVDSKGNVYLSDFHETIFVCDGTYIANKSGVTCLADKLIKSKRAKVRTARYALRINGVLTFQKRVMASDASANASRASRIQ